MGEICFLGEKKKEIINENSVSDSLNLKERNELIKFSSIAQLAMQISSFLIFINLSLQLQSKANVLLLTQ
jgi:hypothetical protein